MKKIIVYAVTLVTLSIITMFIFNSKYKIVQNHNTKLKLPTLIWTYYEEEVIKKSQSYPYYIIRYVDSKHCIPCKLSYQELQHIFDMVNAKQKLLGAKIIFNSYKFVEQIISVILKDKKRKYYFSHSNGFN